MTGNFSAIQCQALCEIADQGVANADTGRSNAALWNANTMVSNSVAVGNPAPAPRICGESPARGVGQETRAFHLVTSGSHFRLAPNSLPPTFRLLFSLHSTSTRIWNKAPFPQPSANPTRQGGCECVQTSAQDLEAAMGCYLTEEQRTVFKAEWLIPPPTQPHTFPSPRSAFPAPDPSAWLPSPATLRALSSSFVPLPRKHLQIPQILHSFVMLKQSGSLSLIPRWPQPWSFSTVTVAHQSVCFSKQRQLNPQRILLCITQDCFSEIYNLCNKQTNTSLIILPIRH